MDLDDCETVNDNNKDCVTRGIDWSFSFLQASATFQHGFLQTILHLFQKS